MVGNGLQIDKFGVLVKPYFFSISNFLNLLVPSQVNLTPKTV